jgi:general stress protein 26
MSRVVQHPSDIHVNAKRYQILGRTLHIFTKEIQPCLPSTLKERILEVVKEPTLAGLATITEDCKPWVRYVIIEASDDMTFRFPSPDWGRKNLQIQNDPEVHLTCGITFKTDAGPDLQIQRRAEYTKDREVRHACSTDRLSLIFDGPDDPKLGVITVTAYRIEVWMIGQPEYELWERE